MAAEPAAAERLRAVPAPEAEPEETHPRARGFLRLGFYAVLILSPLPFGSVQSWAVLALELAAATLGTVALVVLIRRDPATRVPRLAFAFAAALIVLGVLQILPGSWGRSSAPGARARAAVATFVPDTSRPTAPWSLAPPETVDATARLTAFVLLSLAAVVAFQRTEHLATLAVVIVASATFQSIYGTAEYLSGSDSIFAYKKKYYLDSATGTFINRNHFAGYLAASLPFVFAATAWFRERAQSPRTRTAFVLVGTASTCVVWIGILLSQSRAGLAVAVGAVCAYTTLVGFRRKAVWSVVAVLAVAVVFVLWRDVKVPAARLTEAGADLTADSGRPAVWRDALAYGRRWPVVGAGWGTFEAAFSIFTAEDGRGTYDHAHNEYVQAATEGGVLGLGLLAMLGGCLAFRMARMRRQSGSVPALFASVAASIFALSLHSVIDFPLRIPAAAALGATLVGALLPADPNDRDRENSPRRGGPSR